MSAARSVVDLDGQNYTVEGDLTDDLGLTADETQRIVRAASPLGVAAIEKSRWYLRAKLYHVGEQRFKTVVVLVDSGSEVCLVSEEFFGGRRKCRPITVAGINADQTVREEGKALLLVGDSRDHRAVAISTLCVGELSGGAVQLLLSAGAAKMLGLLSSPLYDKTFDVALLPELSAAVDLARLGRVLDGGIELPFQSADQEDVAATSSLGFDVDGGAEGIDETDVDLGGRTAVDKAAATARVAIADALVRKSLERQGNDPFPTTPMSLDDITIAVSATADEIKASGLRGNIVTGGAFTIEQARRVRAVLERHHLAFATARVPIAVDHPPVKVKLRPGADGRPPKPVHVPRPSVGPHQHRFLFYYHEYLKHYDLVFPAPLSPWCSYTHCVGKAPYDDDGVPKGLRPVQDARAVNERVDHLGYAPHDGREELDRASARSRYRFSSDALSAFTAFELSPEASELFTTWLPASLDPKDGWAKVAPRRLIFGFAHAPRIQASYYNEMRAALKPTTRALFSLYVDDTHLGSPFQHDAEVEFEVFLDALEDLLSTLVRFRIQLSPLKTSIGRLRVRFFGFDIMEDGGCSIGEDNTAALRRLEVPSSVATLRSALGFMGFMKDFAPRYADMAAPLFALTTPSTVWDRDFTQEHRQAFLDLRQLLIDSTTIYKPDPELRLQLQVDASDVGLGVRCFQVTDEGVERNVAFWSRRLTAGERGYSATLRECLAVVYGLEKVRFDALSSSLPVLVYSDHQSLRFMQQVQRGSLSAQHFALIGDVQYELRWLPGANNVAADYLSRYHTTSPHEFNTQGLEAAVAELLGRLKDQHRDDDRWWVYSHVDMDAVVAVVQQWRRSTRLPLRSSTKGGAMDSKDWTFALLVPSPLTAAKDAAALLRSGRPGCVLVPADLVSSIIDKGGGYDAELGVRLRASPMISFPVANFLWIGSGVTFDNAVCLPVTLRTSARVRAKAGLAPAPSAEDVDRARRDCVRMLGWELQDECRSRGIPHYGRRHQLVERLVPALAEEVRQAVAGGWGGRDSDLPLPSKGLPAAASSSGSGALAAPSSSATHSSGAAPAAPSAPAAAAPLARRTRAPVTSAATSSPAQPAAPAVEDVYDVTSVIQAALAAIGTTADWPRLQNEDEVPLAHRMRRQEDGMVMYQETGKPPRVLVPKAYRQRVIALVHEEAGHGVRSTAAHLARVFWWPKLAAEVQEYTAACKGCVTTRRYVQRLHGLYRNQSLQLPARSWALDLKKIGTGDEARQILAAGDRFCSFLVLVYLPNKTSSAIIAGLLVNLVYVHGQPASLLVDADSPFVSTEFRAWCARHGTRLLEPLPYAPGAHGLSEAVWKHVQGGGRRADRFPPGGQLWCSQLAWSWNISPHSSTGIAPFTVMYGRPAYTLADRLADGSLNPAVVPSNLPQTGPAVHELLECAQAVRGLAAARGNHTRREAAVDLNRRARSKLAPIPVGADVYYYLPPAGSGVDSRGQMRNVDFRPLYAGPARVHQRLSRVGYLVVDGASGRPFYRHRQHLRLASRVGGVVPSGSTAAAGEVGAVAVGHVDVAHFDLESSTDSWDDCLFCEFSFPSSF